MPTRAAAARAAAALSTSKKTKEPQLFSPPATPSDEEAVAKRKSVVGKTGKKAAKPARASDAGADEHDEATGNGNGNEVTTKPGGTKRKRGTAKVNDDDGVVNGERVSGGWDELPHNMGKKQLSGAGEVGGEENTTTIKSERDGTDAVLEDETPSSGKRMRKPRVSRSKEKSVAKDVKTEETKEDDLATTVKNENLDGLDLDTPPTKKTKRTKAVKTTATATAEVEESKPKRKRATKAKKLDTSDAVQDQLDAVIESTDKPVKKTRKPKKHPYGLTPGESPFPDFPMPTLEACTEVQELLSKLHGNVRAPKEVPAPSLEVTGCGEVPSVLDALIRTRLSAATTSTNAKYAFEGLVKRYGICQEGIGKGSVDWNKVRESPQADIAEAIKRGGLAFAKSKSIKAILEMVYQENTSRRDMYLAEREAGQQVGKVEGDDEKKGLKDLEIASADQNVLTLQYLHGLSPEEAMTALTKFPGIGVKTASCVILFCMQKPSFAVDTHVWRLCKWLQWVPEKATRDQTFSHCEVRIPNEMKYSLHQLFIKHGKTCGRCRAITGESSESWATTECPIEALVVRTGARKGGAGAGAGAREATTPSKSTGGTPRKSSTKKAVKKDDSESEVEMSEESEVEEMPELNDDDEDAEPSSEEDLDEED